MYCDVVLLGGGSRCVRRRLSFWQPPWRAPPPARARSPRPGSPRGSPPATARAAKSAGFGALWVANAGDATIARIDPATNKVTGEVQGRQGPVRSRLGRRRALDRRLRHEHGRARRPGADEGGRADPDRAELLGRRVRRRARSGRRASSTARSAGSTRRRTRSSRRSRPARGRARCGTARGAIWVGNGVGKNVWRIDPATNKARAVPDRAARPGLPRRLRSRALGGGELGLARAADRPAGR